MLFTRTDSFIYELKSENVYEEFFKHKHLFDFSNYAKDSDFLNQANKKVIGKTKDDPERKIIGDFVGLKSKMFSMKRIDGNESNTAKGMNIGTEFNDFKDTLFNKKVHTHKIRRNQSTKYQMGTQEIKKILLSVFDDKRFVLNDGIHMLLYFYKHLKKNRFSQMIIDKKRLKKILTNGYK